MTPHRQASIHATAQRDRQASYGLRGRGLAPSARPVWTGTDEGGVTRNSVPLQGRHSFQRDRPSVAEVNVTAQQRKTRIVTHSRPTMTDNLGEVDACSCTQVGEQLLPQFLVSGHRRQIHEVGSSDRDSAIALYETSTNLVA